MSIQLRRSAACAAAAALALLPGALAGQAIGKGVPTQAGQTGAGVGLTGATFLELPVGAREAALSGAAAATTNGLTAYYWNTAATAELRTVSATLSRNDLYGGSGLTQTYAAIGIPVGASAVGLSFNYFTSGDIIRTTEAFPNGGDPAGGGTIEWNGYAAGIHGARRLTDRLSVGLAGKYISEGSPIARAHWVAFDLSTIFRTGLFGTTVAASVQNLGSTARFSGKELRRNIPTRSDVFPVSRPVPITFDMEKVELPSIVQFAVTTEVIGGSTALMNTNGRNHALFVNGAVTDPTDRAIQPLLGVEYSFRNLLSLRAGKRFYTPDDGPWSMSYGMSYGIGLNFPVFGRRFTFDYANFRMSSSDLPLNNAFTVQFGY